MSIERKSQEVLQNQLLVAQQSLFLLTSKEGIYSILKEKTPDEILSHIGITTNRQLLYEYAQLLRKCSTLAWHVNQLKKDECIAVIAGLDDIGYAIDEEGNDETYEHYPMEIIVRKTATSSSNKQYIAIKDLLAVQGHILKSLHLSDMFLARLNSFRNKILRNKNFKSKNVCFDFARYMLKSKTAEDFNALVALKDSHVLPEKSIRPGDSVVFYDPHLAPFEVDGEKITPAYHVAINIGESLRLAKIGQGEVAVTTTEQMAEFYHRPDMKIILWRGLPEQLGVAR